MRQPWSNCCDTFSLQTQPSKETARELRHSSYLDERVELTLMLASSWVSMVHLQSVVNCDNANANFR